MDFAPGDKVICVDNGPRHDEQGDTALAVGAYYTVADVIFSPSLGVGVKLREISIEPGYSGFYGDRFRTVDDDHELEVFRRILVDA